MRTGHTLRIGQGGLNVRSNAERIGYFLLIALRLRRFRPIELTESMPDEQRVYLGVAAIVASQTMRQVMDLVARAARTTATVLITGETGTGKEIVARAIHHYSLRAAKPWVDFNCAALPEHLVESELFGHEKGAFSGADYREAGTVRSGQYRHAVPG